MRNRQKVGNCLVRLLKHFLWRYPTVHQSVAPRKFAVDQPLSKRPGRSLLTDSSSITMSMNIRPGKPTGPQVSTTYSHPKPQTILFVKNLSFKVTSEEMYDLFGRFGPIRQIRLGNKNATRGTAYVVYETPLDAKMAVDKLNGFSFGGRFLVVLFHQLDKVVKPEDLVTRQEELERLKKQYNVS